MTSELSGSNNVMICFANNCTVTITIKVITTFKSSPIFVVFFTRSISFDPIFCPAIAVTACPIAQQGIPANVLILSPTPDAAATDTPKLLSIPVITR